MRMLQRIRVRLLFLAVLAVGIVVPASVAHAVKYWKNSAGSGNWNVSNNWSAVSAIGADNGGVPTAGENVNITNADGTAHTVTLNTTTPLLGLLSIDYTGVTGANTLSITSNNTLNAQNIWVGGWNGSGTTTGRGAITQTAGTVSISAGAGFLDVGPYAGSTGTYNLGGTGALSTATSQYIGDVGTGVFNHTGGTNTISGANNHLYLGYNTTGVGTYTISGGTLTLPNGLIIGRLGTGVFTQSGGTTNLLTGGTGSLTLGALAGSSGTYNLSNAGNLFSDQAMFIGDNGTGHFNKTGGDVFLSNDLYLGNGASGVGTLTMSGGVFNAGNVFVGNAGTGTLTIQGSARMNISGLSINGTSNVNMNGGTLGLDTIPLFNIPRFHFNSGKVSLSGDRHMFADIVASQLFGFGQLTAGKHGEVRGIATFDDEFEIKDGGVFSSQQGVVGSSEFSPCVVTVSGPGTVWFLGNSPSALVVADFDSYSAELNVRNGAVVYLEGGIHTHDTGVINLDGGTIRFSEWTSNPFTEPGAFNFYSGTLQLIGNRTIGPDETIQRILGSAPTLTSGKELSIEGAATLEEIVTLDSGTLTAASIVNGQNLKLQRGTLNITNQVVTIQVGGLLGNTLDLNDDMTVNVSAGVTNQGLVTGDGQIGGVFTNAAAGELRGEPGKSLKLTGGSMASNNFGRITLYGGMIEFTQNLFNNGGAFISGNGTLKTNTLINSGTMNFAGTANILGTVINNSGGKVISGGGGATIFYGDVTNNGEIRTSTNGFTVFFGSVTGSGTFTGTGTVNFEGDLSPGSSPAAVNFAGDVVLGAAASLQIEIGGLTAGTQHDKLTVAGDLSLDGALEVLLISGFNPIAGQTFNILDWIGARTGTFSSLALPTLAGLAWDTSQLYTNGILAVAAGLAGDFNHDGTVDAADYVVWRKTDGTPAGYNLWRAHFGQSAGSGSGATGSARLSSPKSASESSVPEPPSLTLLMFTALAVLGRKPKRGTLIVTNQHSSGLAQISVD